MRGQQCCAIFTSSSRTASCDGMPAVMFGTSCVWCNQDLQWCGPHWATVGVLSHVPRTDGSL